MNEEPVGAGAPRNIWLRGLLMVLMGLAYQLAATLLFFLAFIQFVLVLLDSPPNVRLTAFGRNLGRYQGQIADFVSFADDQPPFPFTDWPANDEPGAS